LSAIGKELASFTVMGRAVPAVRMTQRSKFTLRAQRYLRYKSHIGWTARQHFRGSPTKEPVAVETKIYLKGGNQGDVDNYFKSVADSLNKIVYKDDRQIKMIKASKIECNSKEDERVEVRVYEIEEQIA